MAILVISGLTDDTLTDLAGIFSALEEVQGNLPIQNNAELATITGFVALSEGVAMYLSEVLRREKEMVR